MLNPIRNDSPVLSRVKTVTAAKPPWPLAGIASEAGGK
jgi:hypothetical protein